MVEIIILVKLMIKIRNMEKVIINIHMIENLFGFMMVNLKMEIGKVRVKKKAEMEWKYILDPLKMTTEMEKER